MIYLLYELGPYQDDLIDIFATKKAAEREIAILRILNKTAAYDIQEREPRG